MVVGAGQTGDDRTGGIGVLRVVVSVEAVGHMSPLEAPTAVNAAIDHFLAHL